MQLRWNLLSLLASLMLTAAASAQAPKALKGNGVPTFSKVFTPDTIGPGSVSMLTFTIDNTAGPDPVELLAFSDTLPGGMDLAAPAFVSNECGGTVTAADGGDTITLAGGELGAGQVCEIVFNVTATDSSGSPYTNTTGALTSTAGNSGTASDDLMVDDARPGFSKAFSMNPVPVGGRSTLTFTIDNSLNASFALALSFNDPLPAGMVVAGPANAATDCNFSSAPVLTAAPGTAVISLSSGGVAASSSCTVSVDVIGGAIGSLGNVSDELLYFTPAAGSLSSGKASDVLDVTGVQDLLELSKEFIDDPVAPGGTTTLEFTITNKSRDDAATGITFGDDLETTLTGLTPTLPPIPNPPCGAGSNLVFGGGALVLTGGSLPPAGSCTFSVDLSVPAGAVPGSYPNTTDPVSGTVGGSPETGNMAGDLLFVVSFPILTREFTDDPVGAGGVVTIEYTITNQSTTSALSAVAFDDVFNEILPTSPSGAPAPGFCGMGSTASFFPLNNPPMSSTTPAQLSISGASLAMAGMPGDSCTFSITLDVVPESATGIYPNTTSNISGQLDDDPGMPTVVGPPAKDDLEVIGGPQLGKVFTDDPVAPGGTVTLEFTLSHDPLAAGSATGIGFTDDLAALVPAVPGLTATLPPMPNPPCGPGSSLTGSAGDTFLTFAGATLAPGADCTFSVTLDVPAGASPGTKINTTSEVTATVTGVAVAGAEAQEDFLISGFVITKEFTDDPVIAGDTATLEFTLDNTLGTVDATSISFGDDLDDALPGLVAMAPLPAAPCGGTFTGTSDLSFSGGTVTAGTSCNFSVTVLVPAMFDPPGPPPPLPTPDDFYLNATDGQFAILGAVFVALDPATDRLEVNSTLLQITKEFTDDPVAPGDPVTLRFTLENLSATETVNDIGFDDDLDAALSGLVATGTTGMGNTCGGMATSVFPTSLFQYAGGTLLPGASCTITLSVDVPGAPLAGSPPFVNTTSGVTGTVGALDVYGAPASDILDVELMLFSKAFGGPATPSGTAVLTFTIENLDAVNPVSGLAFSDDLAAVIPGLTATVIPSEPCGVESSFGGTSFLALTEASLPPGGMCSFAVTVAVPMSATLGDFPNTTSDLSSNGLPVAPPATALLRIMSEEIFADSFED